MKRPITNIDKTIRELTNRLDVVYPYSSYSSTINHQNRNDGINYWKGKKIISIKDWNDLYKKNSTYTDTYKITLTSRIPLQYFPDDYNGPISSFNEELKEEAQRWNKEYYELLEFRKNPTLGRNKCSRCIFSTDLDDPLFVGIEKVIARIISKHCNNSNNLNFISNTDNELISYPCRVMNFFQCPFESNNNNQYLYTKEQLFALQRVAFAIEQAISIFHETTKQNEIICEVDFANDRVQEIHTKYNGEPESWGWQKNVNEQLSKVKLISTMQIRDERDIYDILTNREKLEYLLKEYEKNQLDRELQVCCDENIPCVPPNDYDYSNSNNILLPTSPITTTITELLTAAEKQQKLQEQDGQQQNNSHKGKNCHSKNTDEQSNELEKELTNDYLKPELKAKIKDELEKSHREQLILLKQNKQNIINFLLDNKESIRVEDLRIYEPIYKCYREKGNCHVCNILSNILCKNCNHYKNEVWLCTNHWQQHAIENH